MSLQTSFGFYWIVIAAYRLTQNKSYEAEALRWCDTFVKDQVLVQTFDKKNTAGYWGGALRMDGGLLESCLVYSNSITSTPGKRGV